MATFLQDQLIRAQQKQAHWANQHRQSHLSYNIGDIVYVDACHFAGRKSKSLSMKNADPWENIFEYS